MAAYRVEEYKREEHLILKKNPHYFGAEHVKVDEIKIVFVKDEAALLPLLKSHKVDIVSRVPVLQVSEMRNIAEVVGVPVNAVTYLGLNTKRPPFNDVKNRLALRKALSDHKEEMVSIVNTGELAANFFLPEVMWPAPIQGVSEGAVARPAPSLEFSIQSDQSSRNQTILEWTQSVLKKEYSWKPKLDLMEFKAHYTKLRTEPDEAYRFGWQNPISDSSLMYQTM